MKKQALYGLLPLAALTIIFCGIFFPGMMSSDSEAIYKEVLKHSYSDHHPPMMAYLWHYLNYLHPGPALMYLFNMLLLWASIYILALDIFKNTKYLKYYCMLIPFIPQVIVYAGWIWKDIIFTFGYGLLSMYLAHKIIRQEKISWPASTIFFISLCYFTSVKYQAQFICPIIICWFFYTQNLCKFKIKVFLATFIASTAVIVSVNGLNYFLVTERGTGSSHSWQYVKIFDLAGMSVNSDTLLIPKKLLTHTNVTVQDIKNTYTLAWETLIVEKNSVIRVPVNDEERKLLLITWQSTVLHHPLSYLKHRYAIWEEGLLLSSPGKLYLETKLENHPLLASILLPLANLTAFIYLIPFMLASIIIAIRSLRYNYLKQHAVTVLFLSTMSVSLVAILFVKSLASVPRYVYFSVYLFMLSTPFTVYCLKSRP